MMLNIFSCACLLPVYLRLKSCLFSVFCLCFNWVICFLTFELWDFFMYSRYYSFVRYMIYKYFFPVFGLSFYLLNNLLPSIHFKFLWSPLCQFFLLWNVFLTLSLRTLCSSVLWIFSIFFSKFYSLMFHI